jgi:signal transduction histidine kinase
LGKKSDGAWGRGWYSGSLLFRLVAPVFAVIVIISVMITSYLYWQSKERFVKKIHTQLHTAASLIRDQVSIAIAVGDTPQLSTILKNFTAQGDFVYSSVFDAEGKCCLSFAKGKGSLRDFRKATAERPLSDSPSDDEPKDYSLTIVDDGPLEKNTNCKNRPESVYEIVVPLLVLRENNNTIVDIPELLPPAELTSSSDMSQIVGSLRIGLSIYEEVQILQKNNFYAFKVLFTIALSAFIIISVSIQSTVSKIQAIASCADNVVGGRLDQRADVTGNDEVSDLARSFNSMMERLDNARILEKCLQRTQKLASIGEIAAGVAHEFNNVLQIIGTHTELAALDSEGNSELEENLKVIMESTERASKIVDNLLAFSKRKKLKHSIVSIQDITDRVLVLMSPQFRSSNIVVIKDFKPIPKVFIDEGQLQQVLMNLFTNAQHAMMPDGGTLTVKTEFVPCRLCRELQKNNRLWPLFPEAEKVIGSEDSSDKTTVSLRPEQEYNTENGAIKIVISDTGTGIAPKDLDRIFDPFYSTKGVYGSTAGEKCIKGTGIGLAVCFGIITNHNGRISVKSKPGEGSSFTILFPYLKKPLSLSESSALDRNEQRPIFQTPPYLVYRDTE